MRFRALSSFWMRKIPHTGDKQSIDQYNFGKGGSRLIRNTSPFLKLHARADSVNAKMGAGGGSHPIWNTPPFFGLHARADSVHGPRSTAHAKKLHEKGTDRAIDKRTLRLYERIGLRADSLKKLYLGLTSLFLVLWTKTAVTAGYHSLT